MANGLPIIATNQGAIIESVINDENGFIVPAERPVVIADRLEELIRGNDLREQFSEQSKMYYNTHFTEEKMVNKLEEVFNAIL